ncbi:hypothetical protein SCALM49S_08997 [Streptomyces californicus]
MRPSMSASRTASGEPAAPASSSATRRRPPRSSSALADPHQQLGEHRVLAGEVPVQAGAADADGGAYLVDAHTVEAALGEEPGGLLEDLLAAGGGVGSGGHGINSRQGG